MESGGNYSRLGLVAILSPGGRNGLSHVTDHLTRDKDEGVIHEQPEKGGIKENCQLWCLIVTSQQLAVCS